MIAILSDIHGNLEAARAVLADVDAQSVDAIYCLGDLVVYGPDSIPCVWLAMEWDVVLMGCFDHAIAQSIESNKLQEFNPTMREMLRCVHTELRADDEVWRFFADRQKQFRSDDVLYVHTVPTLEPLNYIFPEDIYDQQKMERVTSDLPPVSILGNTHIAGVFEQQSDNSWRHIAPQECGNAYRLDPPSSGRKCIANVGSVGQPRDGNPRASYVLFDGDTIRFRRIDYDIEKTVAKLRAGDDVMHGDRLRYGR